MISTGPVRMTLDYEEHSIQEKRENMENPLRIKLIHIFGGNGTRMTVDGGAQSCLAVAGLGRGFSWDQK